MKVMPNDESVFGSSARLCKGKNTEKNLMLTKNALVNETRREKKYKHVR